MVVVVAALVVVLVVAVVGLLPSLVISVKVSFLTLDEDTIGL